MNKLCKTCPALIFSANGFYCDRQETGCIYQGVDKNEKRKKLKRTKP